MSDQQIEKIERHLDKQVGKKGIQPMQDTGTFKLKDFYDQMPNI